jgi:hypothetical protein
LFVPVVGIVVVASEDDFFAAEAPVPEVLLALAKAGFAARFDGGGLVIADLRYEPGYALRVPPPALIRLVFDNAERLGAWLEADGAAPLRAVDSIELKARHGCERFIIEGWAAKALELSWTADELFRTPPVWSRADLTGVAYLVGDKHIVSVDENSITIETVLPPGTEFTEQFELVQLKLRRAGR